MDLSHKIRWKPDDKLNYLGNSVVVSVNHQHGYFWVKKSLQNNAFTCSQVTSAISKYLVLVSRKMVR